MTLRIKYTVLGECEFSVLQTKRQFIVNSRRRVRLGFHDDDGSWKSVGGVSNYSRLNSTEIYTSEYIIIMRACTK